MQTLEPWHPIEEFKDIPGDRTRYLVLCDNGEIHAASWRVGRYLGKKKGYEQVIDFYNHSGSSLNPIGFLPMIEVAGFINSASHDPANSADKAPAELVPVAFTTKNNLARLKERPFEGCFIWGAPNGSINITLYGPEAAERIAALEVERDAALRMQAATHAACNHHYERAETAEASAAELRAAGAALANCAYNLSQNDSLPARDRLALTNAHQSWDAALAQKEGER